MITLFFFFFYLGSQRLQRFPFRPLGGGVVCSFLFFTDARASMDVCIRYMYKLICHARFLVGMEGQTWYDFCVQVSALQNCSRAVSGAN